MASIRVGIVGVGNCASSLVQGVHYYRDAAADERVRVIPLSRNFGHQAALTAGLDHAQGNPVVERVTRNVLDRLGG